MDVPSLYNNNNNNIVADSLMAALLGRIDQFNPEQEEWSQYVERLIQFFEANDIIGEDKAAKRRATSLVPRPSPAPVFDRLQYAKTEGEGLVNLTT